MDLKNFVSDIILSNTFQKIYDKENVNSIEYLKVLKYSEDEYKCSEKKLKEQYNKQIINSIENYKTISKKIQTELENLSSSKEICVEMQSNQLNKFQNDIAQYSEKIEQTNENIQSCRESINELSEIQKKLDKYISIAQADQQNCEQILSFIKENSTNISKIINDQIEEARLMTEEQTATSAKLNISIDELKEKIKKLIYTNKTQTQIMTLNINTIKVNVDEKRNEIIRLVHF
ncbi:hypothetical protein A3Q56_04044 [Intoshia linei]|uniref:Uncharacterized protein n=1 Tax=Intoshia linei TaxID=1819745 RepID=A0A177B1Q8_9BILA|nr:hypothetical protein A3Q56_04044 [Intoshia linei]